MFFCTLRDTRSNDFRRKGRVYVICINQVERGKPVPSHNCMEGFPRGTLMKVRVQEDGKSERLAVTAGIGVETLPCPKGCRLPSGLSLQESLKNF